MAETETQVEYFEQLNISVLSISKIKELIKHDIKLTEYAWKKGETSVEKQCFHIIGPAGVGKTAICNQITDELSEELKVKFDCLMIKAPVLSRDDFIIPFPIDGKKFEMLYSDFVPRDKDSYGLFVIDEFSRGDHTLQQLLWQVQNEYKIHLLDFPKHWYVVTIDNPDTSEYMMDTMEDAAGLRRQLHLYSEVSVPDFLNHAIENKFHQTIIEFIQTHPDYLYDFEAQKQGMVFANPASYEKLSHHLIKYDLNGKVENHFHEIEALASGLLNTGKARMFMEFLRDNKDINPKEIFESYKDIQPRILKFVKDDDNAALSNVMTSFITYLSTSRPDYKMENKRHVSQFLVDIPLDTAAIFITAIDSLKRDTPEFKYIAQLHVEMNKEFPDYKTLFYEVMVEHSKEEA